MKLFLKKSALNVELSSKQLLLAIWVKLHMHFSKIIFSLFPEGDYLTKSVWYTVSFYSYSIQNIKSLMHFAASELRCPSRSCFVYTKVYLVTVHAFRIRVKKFKHLKRECTKRNNQHSMFTIIFNCTEIMPL